MKFGIGLFPDYTYLFYYSSIYVIYDLEFQKYCFGYNWGWPTIEQNHWIENLFLF